MSASDFIKKHKISVGLVGTTVVLTTAYGSCHATPSLPESDVPAVEAADPAPSEPAVEAPTTEDPPSEDPPAEDPPSDD